MMGTDGIYRIHDRDNVGTALADFPPGPAPLVGGGTLMLLEPVPRGHKVALQPIAAGESVVKYAHSIGTALDDIPIGAWVYEGNMQSSLGLVQDRSVFAPGKRTQYTLPVHPRRKGGAQNA